MNLPIRSVSVVGTDARVSVEADGRVLLSGRTAETVQIELENIWFRDALILGDAWERGYGDLQWQQPDFGRVMPWYFLANEGGKTWCFGVKTGPNALCSWQCDEHTIRLTADVRSGTEPVALTVAALEVCTIVTAIYDGDPMDAAESFCRVLCERPLLPAAPVIFGGNDWYCNYGDTSHEKILEHTRRIVQCCKHAAGTPFMVIDDGWQPLHCLDEGAYYNGGPWQDCNSHFPGMDKTAAAIAEAGAIPGIWIRPLLTAEEIPEECILHHDGPHFVMDPSHPEMLKKVASDIGCIRNWGYRLIKHDFTTRDIFGMYGFRFGLEEHPIHFYDKTKTTAQVIKGLYQTIREAAGPDVLLMGCNTISHLSAGYFELQRTGDDTSGQNWARTKKYGINTLAFRMAQHKTFYFADADCVGITTQIPWSTNRKWLDVLAKSGTALFVSIAQDAYTEEIQKDLTEAFTRAGENTVSSRPLDWQETLSPTIWESAYGRDTYDWE